MQIRYRWSVMPDIPRGNFDEDEIAAVARFLRALSGLYDQAARAATSL